MTENQHQEHKYETKRLVETKRYLENTIQTVLEDRIKFREEIKDAYIDLDYLDSSLSFSKIMLNSTLLDDLEKNFDLLLHARKKPYFARMDVVQTGREHPDKIYIGKVSLYDTSMETPLVVDWRAPIASVYYDGRLGSASYRVEGQEKFIELQKKRQYTIEEGKLLSYMDVDISTTDAFLQASLDGHAGEKLKDIVSTIQAEQNQIIRAAIDKPLIIQGAAGSGKTTIALHRIAYLIYTYADTFHPEDFMIIAPNDLFLDYISTVLPELGANKVRQTTYTNLMLSLIGKKLKLTDSNQKLNELIRTDDQALSDHEKKLLTSAAALKHSMTMKTLLDDFVRKIEGQILPNEDFLLEDIPLIPASEISKMFFTDYSYLPLFKRVDSIQKNLALHLKNRIKDLLQAEDARYSQKLEKIRQVMPPGEERRQKLIQIMDQREERLDRLKKTSKTSVRKYISQFHHNDLLGFYHEFQTSLLEFATQPHLIPVCEFIASQAHDKGPTLYEVEDLAPLVYLKQKIFGPGETLETRMVVIDEAQDFSAFQFFVLKQVLDTERFTILGDLSQGIHMYRSIENWDEVRQGLFDKPANFLTLEQSYRTTIEIMDEANFILDQLRSEDLIKAKPVVRHGTPPSVEFMPSDPQVIQKISDQITRWRSDGLTTLAVITKTSQEAKLVHGLLKKQIPHLPMALIDEATRHFDSAISIIPAHLSKGLEFDAVLITALRETFRIDPLDIKLMYVAMTRAMHRLAVIARESTLDCYKMLDG